MVDDPLSLKLMGCMQCVMADEVMVYMAMSCARLLPTAHGGQNYREGHHVALHMYILSSV